VLFVFSYNNSSKIDSILLDRIQEINVQSYSVKEKIKIAKCHLIEQICKNIGYDFNQLDFSSEVLEYIIENYTLESGVRDLNRKIEKIILKLNVERIYNNVSYDSQTIEIMQEHVDMYLKDSIMSVRKIHDVPILGIVNGLFVTDYGAGGIIPIQVLRYYQSEHHKFTLKLTGCQGNVMRESAHCALTIALNILSEDNKKKYVDNAHGWHLHVPTASIKKNGPSAGCAIVAAFVSQILGKYVKNNYALTGEIELTGCIKSIGGLLLKLCGAKQAGVNVVLIPLENKQDLEKIIIDSPNLLTSDFNVIMVSNIFDVLKHLLIDYDEKDFCLQ
jgi:ATP-dependent Lon protease